MANIVYGQMPTPWELPQQIPVPRAKSLMQKPQGGGKFLVPGGGGGGMVMDVITCYALFLKSDWLVVLLFLLK